MPGKSTLLLLVGWSRIYRVEVLLRLLYEQLWLAETHLVKGRRSEAEVHLYAALKTALKGLAGRAFEGPGAE